MALYMATKSAVHWDVALRAHYQQLLARWKLANGRGRVCGGVRARAATEQREARATKNPFKRRSWFGLN